jgi:hypothetical protein
MCADSLGDLLLSWQVIEARLDPAPPSRFLLQPFQSRLYKPLYPLVGMATAHTNHGGNVGNRHTVSQEYYNPGTSGKPGRNVCRTLPRQERLALGRRETDRKGGFASTSHTDSSQKEYHYVSCRQNG